MCIRDRHNIFNDYEVGELIYFKAILMKRGDEHDLGKIFHARKSIFQDTKPVMNDMALKEINEIRKRVEQKLKPKAKRVKTDVLS